MLTFRLDLLGGTDAFLDAAPVTFRTRKALAHRLVKTTDEREIFVSATKGELLGGGSQTHPAPGADQCRHRPTEDVERLLTSRRSELGMIPYRADDTADPTEAAPVVTIGLIAYPAHVGGFVMGLLLVRVFTPASRVDQLRTCFQI